jgi:hypothetical protein
MGEPFEPGHVPYDRPANDADVQANRRKTPLKKDEIGAAGDIRRPASYPGNNSR